jgi:hypothetical protein
MEAKPIARSEEARSDKHLRLGVLMPHRRHHRGAGFLADPIDHTE